MTTPSSSDRLSALKQFDATKTGVRGLVESGTTNIPQIFRHTIQRTASNKTNTKLSIPTVDLSLPNHGADVVAAAKTWGFFQVTNHGVPLQLIDRALTAVRSFHELAPTVRSKFYTREANGGVSYNSNFDLYRSSAASWRDAVEVTMGPTSPDFDRIPPELRDVVPDWDCASSSLCRRLLCLLSEGLGVEFDRFDGLSCVDGRVMVCHYYPPCPEPECTVGTAEHKDPSVVTVLVQDNVGGLQVKRIGVDGEEVWVDVVPVPGAIVINVGDLLQILSNDVYKSVEHRVLANSHDEPRVSIAFFFNPGKRGDSDIYGPLPELISAENPARYRNLTMPEFLTALFSKGLGSLLDNFKL